MYFCLPTDNQKELFYFHVFLIWLLCYYIYIYMHSPTMKRVAYQFWFPKNNISWFFKTWFLNVSIIHALVVATVDRFTSNSMAQTLISFSNSFNKFFGQTNPLTIGLYQNVPPKVWLSVLLWRFHCGCKFPLLGTLGITSTIHYLWSNLAEIWGCYL